MADPPRLFPDPSPSAALRSEVDRLARELERVRREERDLLDQIRGAREQVRYYDGLLQRLKSEWTGAPNAGDIVRRLG